MGLEGFAEALRGHVTGKQKAREIPKGQRLTGRPTLDKLFEGRGKKKPPRNRTIWDAVNKHGYGQVEISRHSKLHYSTVSRLIKSVDKDGSSRLK